MNGAAANQFEWDENRRTSSRVKHGIGFRDATRILDGRPALHAPSDRPGKERRVATGRLSGHMVTVATACRNGAVRIITARRVKKNEQ